MERKKPIRNVLITRFSALGDVAMTLPVLYDVALTYPGDYFFFFTRPLPAKMFLNCPENLYVFEIDLDKYKGIKGLHRLIKKFQHDFTKVDTFVDLHDVLRTRVMRFFMLMQGTRCFTVNKDRKGRRRLCRKNNKKLVPLKSMEQRYLETFLKAGFKPEVHFKSLFQDGRFSLPEAVAPRMPGETWIAIAPFARHKGKIYPLGLMRQVVDTLAARPGYRLFVMGAGREEIIAIDKLAAGRRNVVSTANLKLGLEGELVLMSYCDLMLSMDSANMHLASLVGLPTVSVWGATHPYAGFMDANQDVEDAVQLDMVCRPCSAYGNKPCHRGDYHCMAGIPPRLVIAAIDRKLAQRQPQPAPDPYPQMLRGLL